MIPVVLKPRLYSLRNRLRRAPTRRSQIGRDCVLALFSVAIMLGVYNATFSTLQSFQRHVEVAYLPPSLPLGLMLVFLMVMLLFSNSVAALSCLYLSRDLELLLASPLRIWALFGGKFVDVLTNSSWMAIIFGLPTLLAFGNVYEASPSFYCFALLLLIPFFTIPAGVAIVLVTMFARVVPANRTREVVLVIFSITVIGVYFFLRVGSGDIVGTENSRHVMRVISVLSLPEASWAPSYWTARILGEVLQPSDKPLAPYILMLLFTASAVVSLSYIAFRQLHPTGYSRAQNSRQRIQLSSRRSQQWLLNLTPYLDQRFRALFAKEFKLFARDMTQAVQLVLLLGLCMIYLYNFRVLHTVGDLPEDSKQWWQGFLVLSNLLMGAFVITAVCTRFVFPSMSLEGRAFWILRSAPISTLDILRAKFWFWLVPIATISSVIFTSGALAIQAELHIVFIHAVCSWIVCYGIVGLGVGLGAFFSNFHWEYSAQLTASFGSLLYMITSIFFVFVSMIPAGFLLFLRVLKNSGYPFSTTHWYISVGACAFLLVYLNFFATRWALRLGEKSLEGLMQGPG